MQTRQISRAQADGFSTAYCFSVDPSLAATYFIVSTSRIRTICWHSSRPISARKSTHEQSHKLNIEHTNLWPVTFQKFFNMMFAIIDILFSQSVELRWTLLLGVNWEYCGWCMILYLNGMIQILISIALDFKWIHIYGNYSKLDLKLKLID